MSKTKMKVRTTGISVTLFSFVEHFFLPFWKKLLK